jgi:tRNA(Ile)-lysidine synthetase-like protein
MDLNDQLQSVIKYWFGKNSGTSLWFQSDREKKNEIDRYIYDNFKPLLNRLENIEPGLIDEFDAEQLIGMIICLDQFSRHIYRSIYEVPTNEEQILINTIKAMKITDHIIKSNVNIDMTYVPFMLMPYKHIDIVKYFEKIRVFVSKYIDVNKQLTSDDSSKDEFYLYKFYIDSLNKYVINNKKLEEVDISLYSEKDMRDVCDVYHTDVNLKIENSKLVKLCVNFLKKIPTEQPILISLSGGVDSMTIAHILTLLSRGKRDINAFHLNYGNRNEANMEAAVISQFCKKINLRLYVHKINNFTRNNIERSLYEKSTRTVRFNMYKMLGNNVVLGHIKEDLVENIWTNFTHARDLFNLYKIDEFSIIEGVNILRPFRMVDKKDIYEYAVRNNIPYLKNTTPEWSNRGRIRNEFIPAVHRQFGEDSDNKILYMAESLASYKKLLDAKIFDPLFSSVVYNNFGLQINIADYIEMDLHFWQHVLIELYHKLSISMPSISAIKNFIDRIKSNKLGMINLKSKTYVYVSKKYNLYILEIKKLEPTLKKTPNSKDWKAIKRLLN